MVYIITQNVLKLAAIVHPLEMDIGNSHYYDCLID